MFKDKIESFKSMMLKKTEGNNKRNIENLVVFLILLIITIIAINTIWGDKKEETKSQESNETSYKQLAENLDSKINSNNKEFNEYNLEQSLEDILSKMAGVGKVQVLVTYSETSEVVAMYNEKNTSNNTEETDTNGGTRKISQTDTDKEIIYEEKNGEKVPITQKVIMPKIEGAVITAEGAGNINVKTNIIQAVSAATGLSTYRIQVFEMSV
jgi:stage III sporulation protein AG